MEKLFSGKQVVKESGLFAAIPRINLLFPAENITEIRQHSTGELYLPGADYLHSPGDAFITRPENSRIPFFPESALHPVENLRLHPAPDANAIANAVDGGNLIFNNAGFFALNQIDISYQAAVTPTLPVTLDRQGERLPRFRKKLAAAEALQITLIGDSISEGFNATKFVKIPPLAPCYMEMACMELGPQVNFTNRAIGGTGIQHSSDIEKEYLSDQADLLVIAYGMNNFAAMPFAEFLKHLQHIIANSQAVNPHTEYLIVTSMSGNPLWKPTIPGPHAVYAENLRRSVAAMPPEIALADVAKVWQTILERKGFYDLTGNGVNHPNDYGHRIYASVILEILNNESLL